METVQTRLSVHEQITERMVALLEEGIIPWHSSWIQNEPPMNLISKRPYRGINALLLAAYGCKRNYFLTENQIKRLGGYIRKGEEPHLVIDGIGFKSLNPYYVFNLGQCGYIPKSLVPEPMKRNNPIDVCREVIEQMYHCPRLVHGHPEPVYFLKTDTIYMPKAETFKTQQDYLVAFFKPLVASCKHESRLDWTDLAEYAKFDPAARAQEELIVKIGMFFLRNFTGLAVKSKEYNQSIIQDWIERFRRNPTLAHEASLKAQEAFEFITGMIFDKKEALEMIEDDKLPF